MDKNELIYELIIKDLPVTDFTLKEMGFDSEEINNLIDSQFLIVNNNEYKLASIQPFYKYGLKLILLGNIEKANVCFNKCFELEPTNREYMLRVLVNPLRHADYSKFISFFPLLDTADTEETIKENNMYLYLLSALTRIPSEYYNRVRNFDYDDLVYSYDCKIENKKMENEIRSLIAKSKYKYALKRANDYISKQKGESARIVLLKELLYKVIELENKFKYELLMFAKKKEYDKIQLYLESKSKKRYLKSNETYMLMISKALINLLETRTIPPVTTQHTIYMYEALKGNNYELAKTLNYFYKKDNNQNSIEDNIINMLITDMIDLTQQIKYEDEIQGPVLTKTSN